MGTYPVSKPGGGMGERRDAVVLFDGKNLKNFKHLGKPEGADAVKWALLDDGAMQIKPRTGSIISRQEFTNFRLHMEFRTPFKPDARGQSRGNSGVYLQGRYEVQILDSYGLEGRDNECGGIYSIAKPKLNMCLPPMQWQTYDIVFLAARFDEQGKKIQDARMTVLHNGVKIHEKVKLPKTTTAAPYRDEKGPRGIYLQDHGNPVQYRNIWLVELPDDVDLDSLTEL